MLDLLFPPRADEAALRGVTSDDFLALLSPEMVVDTSPATAALLPLRDPRVRAAVHELKYRRNPAAHAFLSAALAAYLTDADELSFPDASPRVVVPIPLGSARRMERGFNQSEELARATLRMLGPRAPFEVASDVLVRTRETVSQVSLPRTKRLQNMRGAFLGTRPLDDARTYIVLDDVVTTGATIQAAIDALQAAGATRIIPIALARA